MKKILISTGGSGGHVIPGITFYKHLEKEHNVKIVTDLRGSKFFNKNSIDKDIIDVPNVGSNLLLLQIKIINIVISFIKSFFYLKKNKIDILISTGGYMSLPFCLSAIILKIKIYLFEPNMVIGRTNKFILKFSKKILCYKSDLIGLSEKQKEKVFLIDRILSKEIYTLNRNTISKISKPLKLLVIGGSQGAIFFDNNIPVLIKELSTFCEVELKQQVYDTNQIDKINKEYSQLNIKYELFNYDSELYKTYNNYDIIITRSGASTISEISYFGIPFIAIPFPFAKDNHQYFNAKYYLDKNCCWLIDQDKFDQKKMITFFRNLLENQTDYLNKKDNLNKISYQNTWNKINQKVKELVNEN